MLSNTGSNYNTSHFIVNINGTHVANETNNDNEESMMTIYPLCSCGSHNISISVVDQCGRSGRNNLSLIIEDQIPMPQLPKGCLVMIDWKSEYDCMVVYTFLSTITLRIILYFRFDDILHYGYNNYFYTGNCDAYSISPILLLYLYKL